MTEIIKQPTEVTLKGLFADANIKSKFEQMLGKKAQGFITSVLQIAQSNEMLKSADPHSILNAAAVAATLDLPLNNNLGFAYIVPFNDRKSGKVLAQFQIGYKGFIQLAQRSGRFKTIAATPIYEGQIIEANPLTGFSFDFTKKSDVLIGYAAYFQLINGFEKTLYMTVDELKKHGKHYSQTFKKDFGLWKDNFDAMATKTVLKLLLSKFAPLSIDMERAVITDQAIINNAETTDVTYIDNTPEEVDKERERVQLMLADAVTVKELSELKDKIAPEYIDLYNDRWEDLNK